MAPEAEAHAEVREAGEIEVTPAMVEVGIDVLYSNADLGEGFNSQSLREALPLVYRAMEKARASYPRKRDGSNPLV